MKEKFRLAICKWFGLDYSYSAVCQFFKHLVTLFISSIIKTVILKCTMKFLWIFNYGNYMLLVHELNSLYMLSSVLINNLLKDFALLMVIYNILCISVMIENN